MVLQVPRRQPEGVLGYSQRRERSPFVFGIKVASTALLLLFGVFVATLLLPQNRSMVESLTVTVPPQPDEAVNVLREAGVLRFPTTFRIRLRMSGRAIAEGRYELSPHLSVWSLERVVTTTKPLRERTVRMLEGWTILDIASYLEREGLGTQGEVITLTGEPGKVATRSEEPFGEVALFQDFGFLDARPEGVSLEGYLFPDTYRIYEDASLKDILRRMLENFDRRITPELRVELEEAGHTMHEVVTMASIIESEISNYEDRAIAAGILWKRRSSGFPLQIDSSVNYITGKHDPSVARTDTTIDSPYNTYRYPGLPLGPISNPGLDAFLAALRPTASPYWYFLTTEEGDTIFSRSFDEHNANIVRYLR
jgi:UPF0755 protein